MGYWLLTWNTFKWDSLEQLIDKLENNPETIDKSLTGNGRWSCSNNKSIKVGDKLVMLKQGDPPKGIIGIAEATSAPYEDTRFDDPSRRTNYIDLNWLSLINPNERPPMPISALSDETQNARKNWTPQKSGTTIPETAGIELEQRFRSYADFWFDPSVHDPLISEDASSNEGRKRHVLSVQYERSTALRKKCLEHWGFACAVCGLLFEEQYGEIGKDFIHVHHLNPVSATGTTKTNPIEDLRPVCPNCHSMLHKKNPPIGIEELKSMMSI